MPNKSSRLSNSSKTLEVNGEMDEHTHYEAQIELPIHDAPIFNDSSDDEEYIPHSNTKEDNSSKEILNDEFLTNDEELCLPWKVGKSFIDHWVENDNVPNVGVNTEDNIGDSVHDDALNLRDEDEVVSEFDDLSDVGFDYPYSSNSNDISNINKKKRKRNIVYNSKL